jgi:Recombination endonuclease VII
MTTTSRRGRTPTRRHGLGRSGVDALVAQQGGTCAICGTPYEDKPGHRLSVDHDHRHCPGVKGCPLCIRGLLCNSCNNILRLAKDDVNILMKASLYLAEHNYEQQWGERFGDSNG